MSMELFTRNRTLAECEAIIEHGIKTFIDVGNALLEIRDSRLYKDSYATFESYCRERWGFTRMRASQLIAAAEIAQNVNHGLQIPTTERQVRPLAQLEPDVQREVWQKVTESGDKITASRVQEEVDKITKPHVANNSGENEWYTPPQYIEAALNVMGSIDCDPASSEIANDTVKAKTFFTASENGLTQKWNGNIWMNPPYSQPLITQFCFTLSDKYDSGEIKQACALVNNATETAWYQRMLESCKAVCFLKGRIKFIDIGGNASGSPLQGQTILYFGLNLKQFINEFSQFGKVLIG